MKKNFLFIYLLISFLYLEIIFKLIIRINLFDIHTLFVCIFALLFGSLLTLLFDIFNKTTKNILTSIMLFIIGIYFSAHTCLYKFYKFYFQFSTLALADQVTSFASDGLQVILNNIIYIVLYLIPFICFVVYFRKKVNDEKTNYKLSLITITICLLVYMPFLISKNGYVHKIFDSNNMIQVVNKNGVISGLFYDIARSIKGEDTSIEIIDEEPQNEIEKEVVKYDYNSFNIDFVSLNNKTSNKNIIELNNYFANKTPSKQNEYTSFFEGKNLILFMAESFNGIAINPDLTPTLYKLAHNGFEFTNFYSPTIYSTIGGEFAELTGLIPELGSLPNSLSIFRSNTNEYPMGIGNLFKQEGYTTYAYHNSSYSFQDRNIYLKNLGFDNYNASGLGLEYLMDCRHWPASDVDMINVTFDDYINDENFLVFYATVSGHGPYVFNESDDQIAPKYKEMLEEYYGDSLGNDQVAQYLMAYEAGQIELDRALQTLIEKLENAGKLDDTVIALVGDHHPYYLTDRLSMDEYNRLSTYERDAHIELYHSSFVLYNSAMEKVTIDKVGGQLDVIPTLYNLFGLDYDSRLLMGVDLLSYSSGIVIMGDNSWINNQGRYYADTGTSISKDGNELSDSYVESINKKVVNMEKISKMIMTTNYYKFIYDNK